MAAFFLQSVNLPAHEDEITPLQKLDKLTKKFLKVLRLSYYDFVVWIHIKRDAFKKSEDFNLIFYVG